MAPSDMGQSVNVSQPALPEPTAMAPVAPPKKGTSRTIWIVLGILTFFVLFCCVVAIVLIAVASRDTAFQNQVSLYAPR